MKTLLVTPHVGIGPLKLGMSQQQILDTLNQLCWDLDLSDKRGVRIVASDEYAWGLVVRYQSNDFFCMVLYQNDQAVEIGVDKELREHVLISLYDKDVFKTPAYQLVDFLKQYSSCSYDIHDDEDLSYNYDFPEIGLRLWRGDVFHPKLLADKQYMEDAKLYIDEMDQYLYFELVYVNQGN